MHGRRDSPPGLHLNSEERGHDKKKSGNGRKESSADGHGWGLRGSQSILEICSINVMLLND